MSYSHSRLPALSSVRAFEAAARLGSFTRAAQELGLTQSAISRHVRSLEDDFSAQLFRRHGRSIALTPAGKAFFEPITEAMDLIRSASRQMQRRSDSTKRLTISLLPSVAALWLAPRLADFTGQNPTIELHVHASRELVDFALDGIDVGIRYGLGDWSDVRSEPLATETLTAVCSPDFAVRHGLGGSPLQLLDLPLLADDLVDDWGMWFEAAGMVDRWPRVQSRFNETASLYRAAADGLGVALGRSVLVDRALREGELVAPFSISVPATYSYWLVTPNRGEPSPAARLFLSWAREQAHNGGDT